MSPHSWCEREGQAPIVETYEESKWNLTSFLLASEEQLIDMVSVGLIAENYV